MGEPEEEVRWLAHHKFLFDRGSEFTSQLGGVVNTALLLLIAGDKIKPRLASRATW